MPSTSQPLSAYVKTLNNAAKTRYLDKLKYSKETATLPDPYLDILRWEDNPLLWPDLTFGDIYTYLIDTPGLYTKESLKAFKSLDAYNYFVSGHVQKLWYHDVEDAPYCLVKGKVIGSQKLSAYHEAWVCLEKKTASVYCAHCTCMAGLGEVCSHVAAILFKVEAAVKLGLTKSSSTSEACQWNSTFRETIDPKSIAEYHDLTKRNRKEEVKTVQYRRAAPLPSTDVLQELKEACPSASFFTLIPRLDPEETDTASEDEDELNLPQPIVSLYCEDYTNLGQAELNQKCEEVYNRIQVTEEQSTELERNTRSQAVSSLWCEHRKGRVTASQAHRVSHRKDSTQPENLLRLLMGYENQDLSHVKAIKWGVDHEEDARKKYVGALQTVHEDFECRLSGFVIDSERPYLGASADGISTCKCCSPRVLELKCPFKHKDITPIEAANTDSSFCLSTTGDLKKTHQYYTQVQIQMHVNKLRAADFCVYTPVEVYVVQQIQYDQAFVDTTLARCDMFFFDHMLPEILTRSLEITADTDDTENAQLVCICNKPAAGKMIACENPTCDMAMFHYSCVNIRRKPRGKWYCPECKEADN